MEEHHSTAAVKLLRAASWHYQMGDFTVLDSWGVTLLPSLIFSGAEGPQPFQQIQQNEMDCLHGYAWGHHCRM